jgi:hypothetical protein
MLKNAPNNFTKFFFLIRSIFIQDTKHYQTANGIIKLSTAWIFSGFTSNPMHKNVRKRRIGGNKGTNETSSNSVVDALNPMFLFRRCVPWKTSVFFPFSHAKGRPSCRYGQFICILQCPKDFSYFAIPANTIVAKKA